MIDIVVYADVVDSLGLRGAGKVVEMHGEQARWFHAHTKYQSRPSLVQMRQPASTNDRSWSTSEGGKLDFCGGSNRLCVLWLSTLRILRFGQ